MDVKKLLSFESILIFIVLLIFSVYYFEERVFFSDTAFQFFKILNFETFNFETARYSVFITQLPVLFLIKIGVTNIAALSIIFSLTFTSIYFGLFLYILKGLKDPAVAIAFLSIFIISISRSFFHTVTETHQAIVYAVALYAVYKHNFKHSVFNYILPITFIALSLFAHMAAIVFVPFSLLFYHFHYNQKVNKKLIITSSSIVLLILIKALFLRTSGYEQSFLDNLLKPEKLISFFKNSPTLRFLNAHLFDTYFIHIFLLAFNIAYLIKKKKRTELYFYLSYTLLMLFALLVVYNKVESGMMKERAFMPLGVVLCIPFFTYLFEDKQIKKWVWYTASLILIFSTIKIFIAGQKYSNRTEKIRNLITYVSHNNKGDKFIIHDKLLNKKFKLMPSKNHWSYAFETLLITSTDNNYKQLTIFGTHTKNISEITSIQNVFLGAHFWLKWDINKINKKFFVLSSENYIEVK